jgi:two-component system OmpR family sensor kinase
VHLKDASQVAPRGFHVRVTLPNPDVSQPPFH